MTQVYSGLLGTLRKSTVPIYLDTVNNLRQTYFCVGLESVVGVRRVREVSDVDGVVGRRLGRRLVPAEGGDQLRVLGPAVSDLDARQGAAEINSRASLTIRGHGLSSFLSNSHEAKLHKMGFGSSGVQVMLLLTLSIGCTGLG